MTSFVCPYCGFKSSNTHDIVYRYCGRCHVFVDDPITVLMKGAGLTFPEAVDRLACLEREERERAAARRDPRQRSLL